MSREPTRFDEAREVTDALAQRFSNSRIRAVPNAVGTSETMHMLCHLTLQKRDFDLRASKLGQLSHDALGGPGSVQLGDQCGRPRRMMSIKAAIMWLKLAASARPELVRVEQCSSTRGSAPSCCTQRHGGAGESELIEFDELVRAVRLGDAPGAEDGPGNPGFRVPGQFRRCSERLDAGLPPSLFDCGNENLDQWVIRSSLSGREIDVAKLPREARRMLAQPGIRLTHCLHERFDFMANGFE